MYSRDYLMRQIEIAGQMLARILGLAKRGRRDEALGLFDQAYQPLLGVSARVVSTLSEEQLLSLLTSGSMPDLRRVSTVLELLKVEADLLDEAGNRAAAVARYRRALALAGFLAARSEALPDAALAADDQYVPMLLQYGHALNQVGEHDVALTVYEKAGAVALTVAFLHVLEHRRHERQQDLLHVVVRTLGVLRRVARRSGLTDGA